MADESGLSRPVAYWLEALGSGDRLRREEAVWALAAASRAIAQALVGALQDAEPSVRREAASALARIDSRRAREAVPVLIDMLAEGPASDRTKAVACLRQIGPDAAAAVPALERLLAEADADLRGEVAGALRAIRTPGAGPATGTPPRRGPPGGCTALLLAWPLALVGRAWFQSRGSRGR